MISEWSTIIGFCSMMIAKLLGLLPLDCLGQITKNQREYNDREVVLSFCLMEIWKTAARADGKAIHNLMEKDKPPRMLAIMLQSPITYH